MAAVRFAITGRVQGVGFRMYAVTWAERLNITGWVQNRADGSVEVAACGTAEALSQFESALGRGPAAAAVEQVTRLEWLQGQQKNCRQFAVIEDERD